MRKLLYITLATWMALWPSSAFHQKAYPAATDIQGGEITVSVTLSSAQVNALNGTPITLVAAQGAGTWIILDQIVAQFKNNGTAFTSGGGGRLTVGYAGASTISNATSLAGYDTTGFVDQGSSQVEFNGLGASFGQQGGNPVLKAQTAVSNIALVVATSTGSAITGGSGSTITFFVTYHVVNLT